MPTIRQKKAKAGEMCNFFLRLGRVPTVREYRALTDVPMRYATMKRLFGNWNRMLKLMPKSQPELWAQVEALGNPVVEPVVEKEVKVAKPMFKKAPAKEVKED